MEPLSPGQLRAPFWSPPTHNLPRITVLPNNLTSMRFPSSNMPVVVGHINWVYGYTLVPFFSITKTTSEVSVFVDSEAADGFTQLARKERTWLDVSADNFRALQIDSTDESFVMSRLRTHDLATSLAQAGVPISLCSTYQTNYIFVKEKHVNFIIEKLRSNGYYVDDDREQLPLSPSVMASSGDDEVVRTRNSSDSSASVSAASLSLTTATTANSAPDISKTESTLLESPIANESNLPKQLVNHRPDHNLRLVGLDQSKRAQWLKHLVRLMLNSSPGHGPERQRLLSYTQSSDGCSLLAEEDDLEIFPDATLYHTLRDRPQCIQIEHRDSGIDRDGVGWFMVQQLLHGRFNMVYLSTANTAHVLVGGEDLDAALSLLRKEHEAYTTARKPLLV
ncbi:hypothetical protein HK405_001453, partial [Cladochytrium tenue]